MFQLESEDKKIRWPSSKNIKQKNSWYPSLKTIRKEVSSLIKEGQPFCFIQTFNWLMRPTQIRESNLICYWSTAKSCPNLCNPTDSSTPGFPILHIAQSFLKLMSTESVMPSNISSSVAPFSSCPQSFPASGSFPMSQLFTSGGQSIEASASALVLPMNIQGWFPLGLTGLISLQSKGLSSIFSNTTIQKHQFFST